MKSLSEFCVEKNGVVVLDEKRKKKMMEEAEMGARWGDEKCAGMVSSFDCSSCLLAMEFPYFISAIKVQQLADSVGSVGTEYEEMVEFLKNEILPEFGG